MSTMEEVQEADGLTLTKKERQWINEACKEIWGYVRDHACSLDSARHISAIERLVLDVVDRGAAHLREAREATRAARKETTQVRKDLRNVQAKLKVAQEGGKPIEAKGKKPKKAPARRMELRCKKDGGEKTFAACAEGEDASNYDECPFRAIGRAVWHDPEQFGLRIIETSEAP